MGLDEVLFALADNSRRAIVERLTQGPATVGAATATLELGKSSLSRHVSVLEQAGLVTREVHGREHWLTLVPDGMATATEWFAQHHQFWTASLDRLEGLVAELEQEHDR